MPLFLCLPQSLECVLVCDLLQYMPDNVSTEHLTLAGEGHVIVKDTASTRQCLQVAVLLSFTDRCQVCILLDLCSASVVMLALKLRYVCILFSIAKRFFSFLSSVANCLMTMTSA